MIPRGWTVVRPSAGDDGCLPPVHAWGAAIFLDGVLIAEMAAEDASLAARAVNAHDVLVAALERIIEVSYMDEEPLGDRLESMRDDARAALLAAKGEQ